MNHANHLLILVEVKRCALKLQCFETKKTSIDDFIRSSIYLSMHFLCKRSINYIFTMS
jgi:hypothetical protein